MHYTSKLQHYIIFFIFFWKWPTMIDGPLIFVKFLLTLTKPQTLSVFERCIERQQENHKTHAWQMLQ